jgi:hypothetical protein
MCCSKCALERSCVCPPVGGSDTIGVNQDADQQKSEPSPWSTLDHVSRAPIVAALSESSPTTVKCLEQRRDDVRFEVRRQRQMSAGGCSSCAPWRRVFRTTAGVTSKTIESSVSVKGRFSEFRAYPSRKQIWCDLEARSGKSVWDKRPRMSRREITRAAMLHAILSGGRGQARRLLQESSSDIWSLTSGRANVRARASAAWADFARHGAHGTWSTADLGVSSAWAQVFRIGGGLSRV